MSGRRLRDAGPTQGRNSVQAEPPALKICRSTLEKWHCDEDHDEVSFMHTTLQLGVQDDRWRSTANPDTRPIRGLLWGAAFSIPVWIVLVLFVVWLF
jgi:hypothetical protein